MLEGRSQHHTGQLGHVSTVVCQEERREKGSVVRVGPPTKWKETQEDVTSQKLSKKKVSPTEGKPVISSALRPQMPQAESQSPGRMGTFGAFRGPGGRVTDRRLQGLDWEELRKNRRYRVSSI